MRPKRSWEHHLAFQPSHGRVENVAVRRMRKACDIGVRCPDRLNHRTEAFVYYRVMYGGWSGLGMNEQHRGSVSSQGARQFMVSARCIPVERRNEDSCILYQIEDMPTW